MEALKLLRPGRVAPFTGVAVSLARRSARRPAQWWHPHVTSRALVATALHRVVTAESLGRVHGGRLGMPQFPGQAAADARYRTA
jgi:hypothetical protein